MASRSSSKLLPLRALAPSRIAPSASPRPRLVVAPSSSSSSPLTRRLASSYYPSLERPPKKGIKVGHVFAALALLGAHPACLTSRPSPVTSPPSPFPAGIGATSYGLYQFYQSFTAYPDSATHPVRSKLRAALRSAAANEPQRASTFFASAYELALDLYARGELAPTREEAVERLTGIAIRWGGMWEAVAETARAIDAYDTGFQPVAALVDAHKLDARGAPAPSEKEVRRAAAIAVKLGDLWIRQGASAAAGGGGGGEADSEAERYYSWAVQELMRLSLTDEQKAKVKAQLAAQDAPTSEANAAEERDKAKAEGDKDLEVPGWVGEVELVAAMERLGELYSRQGRIECVRSPSCLRGPRLTSAARASQTRPASAAAGHHDAVPPASQGGSQAAFAAHSAALPRRDPRTSRSFHPLSSS